jgi:hypothetical protein
MSISMMHACQDGALSARLAQCASWVRDGLFTWGKKKFGSVSQVAGFVRVLRVNPAFCSETVFSGRNVIANSPTNTSGFYTYIAQVAEIIGQ